MRIGRETFLMINEGLNKVFIMFICLKILSLAMKLASKSKTAKALAVETCIQYGYLKLDIYNLMNLEEW